MIQCDDDRLVRAIAILRDKLATNPFFNIELFEKRGEHFAISLYADIDRPGEAFHFDGDSWAIGLNAELADASLPDMLETALYDLHGALDTGTRVLRPAWRARPRWRGLERAAVVAALEELLARQGLAVPTAARQAILDAVMPEGKRPPGNLKTLARLVDRLAAEGMEKAA